VYERGSALFIGGDCSILGQHFTIDDVKFGHSGWATLTTVPRPMGVSDQELGMAHDASSRIEYEVLLNNTQLLLLHGYITRITTSFPMTPPVSFNDSSKHFERPKIMVTYQIASEGEWVVYNAVTDQPRVISPTKLLTEGV
jgi:hypothetical protein